MLSLSEREATVVAGLEFNKKYYFAREDIKGNFDNAIQMKNTLHRLQKKGRIVKLNRNKYFLIPIKARSGKWTDNPLIISDEMLNGESYFIGGWYAAYYWKLTDQIPMQVDIYSSKRQGKVTLLNKRFVFHRTTEKRIKQAITQSIEEHSFRIIPRDEAKEWIKSRQ